MSTLFFALVATLIAITHGQFDDDCGTTTVTVGGVDLMIQLERDITNEKVRITLTGPATQWFGFVIGQGTMSGGYAITGQGSSYSLLERKLVKTTNPLAGGSLTSSGTASATLNGNGVLVLERDYVGPDTDYYDFTDLMTCQRSSISIAAARGNSLTFAKHTSKLSGQSYSSSCTCPTSDPTKDPTMDPTIDPTIDPTANPTTYAPTVDPTADPTNDPTKEGETRGPTIDPTIDPTANPVIDSITTTSMDSTEAMTTMMTTMLTTEDDGYEACATSELITGYKLNVYRNTDEEKVRIMISGASDVWFGYGFGSSVMTDAYAVTVETVSEEWTIVERTLNKDSAPGTTLTSSGFVSVNISDSSGYGVLERAYQVTNGGFDFTQFMKCKVDSIDLIAAIGDVDVSGTSIGYHGTRVKEMKLERSSRCICDPDTDTDDMTSTTKVPGDGGSANNIFNVFNIMAIVSVCIYGVIMT